MLKYSETGKNRDKFLAIYASQKWLYPYEHFDQFKFPFIISVEPTNLCNNDCLYCSRQNMTRPTGYMALETMQKIANEVAEHSKNCPVATRFGGFGEPLLHPKLPEMIKMAKSAGALTLSFTNGRFLTEEKMEALMSAGLDEIRFSSAGLDEKTHNDVRLKSDYQRDFLGKIQMARKIRDKNPKKTPYLSILTHVLIKGDNKTAEAEKYAEFLLQWADKVAIDLTDYNHVQNIERAKPYFERCGVDQNYQACVELLIRKAVWWDGTIVTCDTYWDKAEDQLVLGNMTKGDKIGDCYKSPQWRKLIDDLGGPNFKHSDYKICQNCYRITDRYEEMKRHSQLNF